ncbi:Armadillo repeat-containing protein 8 [Tolypocladium paradoxum]|uniref:Armadillo repeat-containing protein 8 n=1 Tax=Tolypocladium paradoxum TaxID=94208 RepID=A0A2S4KNV5_9HYPO|nr:Armadillo repeat-containing protein 8 [Tolypocladium paradoxum]
MARPQNSPVLAQLRSAKTYPEQTAALQVLKNEVVGHIQKKEEWIGLGVLDPIVITLSSSRSPSKPNGKDARTQLVWRPLSDEDSVKLQALQLVASFANGGPAFLAPLHAARVVPAVLGNMSPLANPPQIVLAALKALTDIADAAALALPSSPLDIHSLADNVFSPQHIESLNVMLSMSSPKHLLQSQVTLASGLICRLCRDERHQHALATSGVLDSLATQLARFAVRDGLVVPGAEELAYSDGLCDVFPESAYAGSKIGPILEAIAAILGDSRYRANRLVHSPALLAIFPSVKFESYKGAQSQQRALTAMEFILPAVPAVPASSRSQSASQSSLPTPDRSDSRTSSRTSLNKFGPAAAWGSPRVQAVGNNGDSAVEDIETPLIPWLIHLVRTLGEYDRLMAAAVLAALFKAGLGRKAVRETSIGLLVIPILVGMAAKIDRDGPDSEGPTNATQRLILEKTPAVLARLMTDSESLQKAAYDCDAVRVLTKLLKRAYQPVPELDQPRYWSPQADSGMDVEGASASTQLGQDGQDPLLAHRMKLREASLKAIGALSAGKEDYRKALVAEDVVPYVVESLCEYPRKPRQAKERSKDKPGSEAARKGPSAAYGTNAVSVIIAGCHVVRMLARSVSVLRTALVDYGVALPVFQFMTHRDINVQIAATATIINLVVEVSPVRELLTEHGVMRVLCEHAHSDNPALRLNALWAFKHFVDAVGPELKKASLEQLEPGWLVQLICDDTQDAALYNSRLREASGDDVDEDVEMQPSDEPFRWLFGSNGSIRELDCPQSTRLRQAEDRLSAIREAELNPVRRARNDDLAIQEQGLDFIRNLIGRPESGASSETPSETTEMIDYLFSELGQDRLFEILASKLRSKVLHPFSRRTSTPGREPRVVYPQAKIIVAVIYILVHMAASIPRHRQLVIAQTDLLKLLAQQSTSKDREVRVALCHLVINLTWQEDDAEAQQCAARAHELKRLGFHAKMENLKLQDRDLDVRERAKTAAWQIEQATY